VGTATPTGGSADLLTQCIDREPAFVDGPTAWVTNENPRRGETIAVCARLRRDNQPVAGASVYARVQYQTTERELGPQPTGSEGIAALPVDIGTATSGVVVPVYVEIETNEEFFEASTEFIPQ
jgi:hypothetical protein